MLPYQFDTSSVWHTILKGAAALNAVMVIGIVIKLVTGEWATAAGLTGVTTFGIQPYLPAGSPAGAALIAGVVRSLAPAIVRHGIATEQQLEIATLEQRLGEAISQAGAVVLPPTVAGAWGRAPLAQ